MQAHTWQFLLAFASFLEEPHLNAAPINSAGVLSAIPITSSAEFDSNHPHPLDRPRRPASGL
jgi:hypothetical protein